MKKSGDDEIFITKFFNHGIFSNFTKILNHENLELYGIYFVTQVCVVFIRSDDFYLRAVFINTNSCQRGNP